jgi:hypothetical protein
LIDSFDAGIVCRVPAPFTSELCGYRLDRDQRLTDRPNTSDSNDDLSIELGRALFDQLGVPRDKVAPTDPGTDMEERIIDYLKNVRPDLRIEGSWAATRFCQYEHLDVFPRFRKNFGDVRPTLTVLATRLLAADLGPARRRIERELTKLAARTDEQAVLVDNLAEQMPEESLLNIDIAVAIRHEGRSDELAVALSSKWSLRTDRAQDCVSQGNKLVAQRRGRMPHFAVVTIEPRPSMLRILADGSGAVDFVYHLDLPALTASITEVAKQKPASWSPGRTFARLMRQNRLRDFDQLVSEIGRVPNS